MSPKIQKVVCPYCGYEQDISTAWHISGDNGDGFYCLDCQRIIPDEEVFDDRDNK